MSRWLLRSSLPPSTALAALLWPASRRLDGPAPLQHSALSCSLSCPLRCLARRVTAVRSRLARSERGKRTRRAAMSQSSPPAGSFPTSLASLALMFVAPPSSSHSGGPSHLALPSTIPASVASSVAWMDERLALLSSKAARARSKYSTLYAGGADDVVLAPLESAWSEAESEMRALESERRATIRKAHTADRKRREQKEREAKAAHRYMQLAEARAEQKQQQQQQREQQAAAARGGGGPQQRPHQSDASSKLASPLMRNGRSPSPPSPRDGDSSAVVWGGSIDRDARLHKQANSDRRRSLFEQQFGGLGDAHSIGGGGVTDKTRASKIKSSGKSKSKSGVAKPPHSTRLLSSLGAAQQWIVEEDDDGDEAALDAPASAGGSAAASDSNSDSDSASGSESGSEASPPQHSQRARRRGGANPRRGGAPSSTPPGALSSRRRKAQHHEEHKEQEYRAHPPAASVSATRGLQHIRLPDPASSIFYPIEPSPSASASAGDATPAVAVSDDARPPFLSSAALLSTTDLSASLHNFLLQCGAPSSTTLTDALTDPNLREKISRTLQAFITKATEAAMHEDDAATAIVPASASRSSVLPASQPQVSQEEKLLWGLLVGTLASAEEEQLCIEWWSDREKQLYSQVVARQRKEQQRAQQNLLQQHARAHQAALASAGLASSPRAREAAASSSSSSHFVLARRNSIPIVAGAAAVMPMPAASQASSPSNRPPMLRQASRSVRVSATGPLLIAAAAPHPPPAAPAAAPAAAPLKPAALSASESHALRGSILTRLSLAQEELRQLKAAKFLNELALRQQLEMQHQAQLAAQNHAQRQAMQAAQAQQDMAYIIQKGNRLAPTPQAAPAPVPAPSAATVALLSSASSIEPMCRRFVYSLLSSALQNRAVLARQDRTISDLRWALAKARRIRHLTHNGSINRPASARPTWISAVSVPTPMPRQLHDGTLVDFLVVEPDPQIEAEQRRARNKQQQQQQRAQSAQVQRRMGSTSSAAPDDSSSVASDDSLVSPVHRTGRGFVDPFYRPAPFDAEAVESAAREGTLPLHPPPEPPSGEEQRLIKFSMPNAGAASDAGTHAHSHASLSSSSYLPAAPDLFAPALALEGAVWLDELSSRGGGDKGNLESEEMRRALLHYEAVQQDQRGKERRASMQPAASGGKSLPRLRPPDASLLGAPPPLHLSPEVIAELQHPLLQSQTAAQTAQWGEFVRSLDHSTNAASGASASSAASDPTGRSTGPPLSTSQRYAAITAALPVLSLDDIPSRLLPRREYQGLSLARPHPDRQPDANAAIRDRERALVARARRAGLDAQFLRTQRSDFVDHFAPGNNSFEYRPWGAETDSGEGNAAARKCAAHCVTHTHSHGAADDGEGRPGSATTVRSRSLVPRPPARPQSSRLTDRVFSIGLSVGRKKKVKPAANAAAAAAQKLQ